MMIEPWLAGRTGVAGYMGLAASAGTPLAFVLAMVSSTRLAAVSATAVLVCLVS